MTAERGKDRPRKHIVAIQVHWFNECDDVDGTLDRSITVDALNMDEAAKLGREEVEVKQREEWRLREIYSSFNVIVIEVTGPDGETIVFARRQRLKHTGLLVWEDEK